MIAINRPPLRLDHALAAATIFFAALAAWPWIVPPAPASHAPAAPPASPPAPALAALPPLTSYAAIIERPLFSPSRRPAPAAAALGPSTESRYRLVGIVTNGPKKKAFITDGEKRVEIVEGDTLDGRTVAEIGPDRVVLSSPDGKMTLRLTQKSQ